MTLDPRTASIAEIRKHLDELEARPLAKTSTSFRDEQRRKVHAAFVAAVEELQRSGWSIRAIARRLEADPVTVGDWLKHGDRKRSQIPGWVFAALPSEARAAWMRIALGWSDPPPSMTGTDG